MVVVPKPEWNCDYEGWATSVRLRGKRAATALVLSEQPGSGGNRAAGLGPAY